MDNGNIISLFLKSAERDPHRIAIIQENEEITYTQLEKSVKRAAVELGKQGINAGDRVLVFIPMSITLYKTVLSLFYMGAIPVFIDQWAGFSRLNSCLKMVECRGVIASRKVLLAGWLFSGFRNIRIKLTPPSSVAPHLATAPAEKKTTDTALITFTTGSTGTPKAADRTHGFLHAQQRALSTLVEGDYERTLTLLPIVVLLNLAAGKTVILPSSNTPKKGSPLHTSLRQILIDKNADAIIGSPSILTGMSKMGSPIAMKQVLTGGGPLYPDEALSIQQAFKPETGVAVYGSTEAEPISTIPIELLATTKAEEILEKGLPLGKVHPELEVAIIPFDFSSPIISEAEWKRMVLQNSLAGEVVVRGAHVLTTGYVDDQDAWVQTKVIVDGAVWHRTGDAGRLDPSNNLYFLGRCAERIIHDSKEIFPVILTYLLKLKCGIADAAVLKKNNELIVVLENKDKAKKESVARALSNFGIKEYRLSFIAQIPKDPRHHTKTDYTKLTKLT